LTRPATLLALLALAASPARADDPVPDAPNQEPTADSQQPISLPPIDVTAAPEAVPEAVAENPSRFVEVVDAAPARERGETAADLVEDVAGVRVRRYGGLGSFATVSIRGSSPTQVPVFVDGIPVGDARSGLVSLEELASADLERIEVYRGFAPADVGEAGIGGAVNLVTRSAPETGATEITTGMSSGSFATWRAWVSGAGALADGESERSSGLRVTFGALRTQGDFRFLSDHGTPAEPADDVVLTRRNNDYLQATAAARLAVPLDGWNLDAALAFVATDQGLPGLDYDQAERARLEGTDTRLRFTAAAPSLFDGLLALETGVYASVRTDRFADPAGEIGVGRQTEDDRTAGGGAFGLATFSLGDGSHLLRARLETGYESFRSSYAQPVAVDGPEQGRWLLRAGCGYEASVFEDALVLLVDARADVHVDSFSGDPYFPARAAGAGGEAWDVLFSPSAGLRWTIADGIELRANGGWFHRVPTFGELFGDRGTVVGNAGLRPESAANVDAGLSLAWDDRESRVKLSLAAAFFGSFADELIVFVPQSQSVFRAENIGSSRTLGTEATLRASWADTVALELEYTFEDARDTGDSPFWRDLRLPGRPPHDLSARLSLRRWGFEVWYEADYVAETPLDRANLRTVPARALHGAGLSYRLSRTALDLTVSVEGRNLGDTWAYDAFRYPLPGRSVFASFTLRL
jgi:outer membrane cobalamin receptor